MDAEDTNSASLYFCFDTWAWNVSNVSQVQEERILHQQVKCIITEEKVCMVCKKKIGNR